MARARRRHEAGQAKQILLKELEDQARHDGARLIRQIEEETKREADRRARNILSRLHAAPGRGPRGGDHRVGRPAPADDMKGRIIGREGRNIRALENLTGVDFIIDDTPGAVSSPGSTGSAARSRG